MRRAFWRRIRGSGVGCDSVSCAPVTCVSFSIVRKRHLQEAYFCRVLVRLPRATVTKQLELVKWKRYDMNQPPRCAVLIRAVPHCAGVIPQPPTDGFIVCDGRRRRLVPAAEKVRIATKAEDHSTVVTFPWVTWNDGPLSMILLTVLVSCKDERV